MNPSPWRVLRHTDPGFSKAVALLNRQPLPEMSRVAAVAEIIAEVRRNGDEALIR